MNPALELHRTLLRWIEERKIFVAATVVATRGSAPRDPGAKMLIPRTGESVGTLGGGAPERQALEAARALLESGGPARVIAIDLAEESACGGRMEIFLEPYRSEKMITIVGAGHVAAATAPLLARLGWDVLVIDPRAERLASPAFAECLAQRAEFADAPRHIRFSETAFILIMTPDHRYDEEVAAACVDRAWRWLGVIGSRRKAEGLRRRLVERGLPEERVARLRVPVGLEIGSDTPEEIAVSIAAELIRETSARE